MRVIALVRMRERCEVLEVRAGHAYFLPDDVRGERKHSIRDMTLRQPMTKQLRELLRPLTSLFHSPLMQSQPGHLRPNAMTLKKTLPFRNKLQDPTLLHTEHISQPFFNYQQSDTTPCTMAANLPQPNIPLALQGLATFSSEMQHL